MKNHTGAFEKLQRITHKGDNMEQIIRFRHNVIHVSSINTFEGIKGGMNHALQGCIFCKSHRG